MRTGRDVDWPAVARYATVATCAALWGGLLVRVQIWTTPHEWGNILLGGAWVLGAPALFLASRHSLKVTLIVGALLVALVGWVVLTLLTERSSTAGLVILPYTPLADGAVLATMSLNDLPWKRARQR